MAVSDRLKLASGEIDLARRRARIRGVDVRLTTAEAGLLRHLAAAPGQAVTRDELLREVWGYSESMLTRTVDVTVRRLRAKIEPDPSSPTHLLSVHGVGYTFVPFEPPPALPAPAHPVVATEPDGILGRAAALSGAWAALWRGVRPLTVAGPAGVGKTRLARALVEEARGEGRAAWLVDLVAAQSATDLGVSVATAVDCPRPTDDVLVRALDRPGVLLVLDNFEQMDDAAAARVGAWLAAAPRAQVVVTSRRPLGLLGEELLRLDPLGPDDAVALFRRRARRVRSDVALDDEATIRGIVTRLDGLPLAIELAAARVRVLSVEELARRLALPLLRDAHASPHRSTMTRALDGSWVLLPDPARRALAALAAVPGATFVAVAERLLERVGIADSLDVLEMLADHSLLRVEEGPVGTDAARVVPFVCVAEYAAAKREEVGVDSASAAWIRALADVLEPWRKEIMGAEGRRAAARCLAETDNALAAVHRHADADPAATLRVAIAHLDATNLVGGHPSELPMLERALPLAQALRDTRAEATLRTRRVYAFDRAGRVADACADADAVAAMYATDPSIAAEHVRAELGRASALRRAQRTQEALRALDALAIPDDAPAGVRWFAESERGLIFVRLGDLDRGAEAFERAVVIAREGGEFRRAEAALDHLALTRAEQGRGAEVEGMVRAAIERRRSGGVTAFLSQLWYVLGTIAVEAGRLDEARACFREEQAAAEARAMVGGVAAGYANLALVELRAGNPTAAAELFRRSAEGYRSLVGEHLPMVLTVGLTLARLGAGEAGVRLERQDAGGPVDVAMLELGRAAVAVAANEAGARERLAVALATSTATTSFDLRELIRYARGLTTA